MIEELSEQQLLFVSSATQKTRFEVKENQHYRWLCMDDVVHSILDKREPSRLVLPHLHSVALALACQPNPQRFLELGLGGGSMLRFLKHYFVDCEVECVEFSDTVIDCFGQYFNPLKQPVKIFLDDAERFMQKQRQKVDWLYVDLFSGFSNPEFLIDLDFYQACWRNISDQGVLHLNLIPASDKTLPRVLGILAQLTDNRPLVAAIPGYQNQLIILSKQAIAEPDFSLRMLQVCDFYPLNPEYFMVY